MRFPFRTICSVLATALLMPCLALAQSGDSGAPGVEPLPPLDLPYPQIVHPERAVAGSLSLGTTSDGRLANAVTLPDDGPHHFVLPEHRSRDTHYGTDEMISLVLRAAESTHDRHGVRVGVGNISAPGGGRFQWSRSHNSGRDADLAFLFVDAEGNPVEPHTLIRVRGDGTARGGFEWTFDVERSWTLVEALITDPEARVQWIFVYEPLAHMLVEHARAIGTDPAIVERAEHVLHQPGDSAPHDDHFHVRIYCSRDDLLEGCANWGPEWPHAELWEDAVLERIDELTRGIADPDAATGSACAERATSLAGDAYGPTLATALPHAEPETQLAIMELLAEIDEPGAAGPLVALLESSPHEDVREQAAWLLGYLADPGTARPLAELVARDGAPLRGDVSLSAAAAIALRNVWSAESVEHLVAVSGHTDPDAREAISVVLSRATGKAAPGTEETTGRDLDPVTLEQHWKAWFVAHGADGQDAWYQAAFSAAGYEVGETWADIPLSELVRALRDDADHIRFIADRTLLQRTDGWTPSEGWSVERRHRYWSRRLGLR